MSICHLINDLDAGGAEFTLLNFLRTTPAAAGPHTVISLLSGGSLLEDFRSTGHRVIEAGMRRTVDLAGMRRLGELLRREKPDILQCWMYHSNAIGLLAGRAAGIRCVLFSLHHSSLSLRTDRLATMLAAYAGALLARWAAAVINCADETRRVHLRIGYPRRRMITIYNGIDTERFSPRFRCEEAYRQRIGVGEKDLLVGLIGRFHTVKNHRGFLQAAAQTVRRAPPDIRKRLRFLFAGTGTGEDNQGLVAEADSLGLRERTRFLGFVPEIYRLLPCLDILVSSSDSEAFPLNVGEAMASGVPCVVTDVGDSALLVGGTGLVVAPGDPAQLADACLQLVCDDRLRRDLGRAARKRVEAEFSLRRMAKEYEDLYDRILHGNHGESRRD